MYNDILPKCILRPLVVVAAVAAVVAAAVVVVVAVVVVMPQPKLYSHNWELFKFLFQSLISLLAFVQMWFTAFPLFEQIFLSLVSIMYNVNKRLSDNCCDYNTINYSCYCDHLIKAG